MVTSRDIFVKTGSGISGRVLLLFDGRGQDAAKCSVMKRTGLPQQMTIQPKMSVVSRQKNPALTLSNRLFFLFVSHGLAKLRDLRSLWRVYSF